MAFINVNKYVLDKVTLEATNDGAEAFSTVVLFLSSLVCDMVEEKNYKTARFHTKGLKCALDNLDYFLNSKEQQGENNGTID